MMPILSLSQNLKLQWLNSAIAESAQTNLEEVVRAEIKARMREHQKLKQSSETSLSRLSASIELHEMKLLPDWRGR